MMENGRCSLANCIPFQIDFSVTPVQVKWVELDRIDLSAPFFFQTIDARLACSSNVIYTDLDSLLAESRVAPPYSDERFGFIFHISRCGSTLVKSLVDSSPRALVLSEPQPLSAITLEISRFAGSDEQNVGKKLDILRALLNLYLLRLSKNNETKLLIKFVSWGTLTMPLILRHFKRTPVLFIFRNPVEVLVSLLRSKNPPAVNLFYAGAEMAAVLAGVSTESISSVSIEEYLSRNIANYLRIAIDCHRHHAMMLLDYGDINVNAFVGMLRWFGLDSPTDISFAYSKVMATYSKDPSVEFRSDVEQKLEDASDSVVANVNKYAIAFYRQLRAL